ncbi:uncharacterized protein LOC114255139 [Monomorium pharaonis]|uniref:uncharacterized protein LOC114255139 n=1 Tax=Monomorium pharaonis TaxID=307658 RepID=UPI001746D0EE|nr:uncharacterized protein LOC114255139 [Monomorium pharaonis]
MHIDKTQRKKLDNKSKEMVLVGYSPSQKGFRLWERGTKHVIVSRDVIIAESLPKQSIQLPQPIGTEDTESVDIKTESEYVEESETSHSEKQNNNSHKSVGVQKGVRVHQSIDDSVASRTRSKVPQSTMIATALLAEGIPETLKEAKQSSDAKQWEIAMKEEITSLEENNTWELTDLPEHRKAIKNKWIFRKKLKSDGTLDRYKARLVIKGCSQKPGMDYAETFAPVARFESIRILVSVTTTKNFVIRQFDSKAAFLHGDLNETIFMVQPEGFDDGSGRVCHLRKSLYRLKQAPRQWYQKLDDALKMFGMKSTRYDPCIYSNPDGSLLLALYVDDGLIAGQSESKVFELLEKLKEKFKTIDFEAKCYLGIEIDRDIEAKKTRIHQSAYIRNLLRRFKMDESNPVSTPSEVNIVLRRNEDENGNVKEPADVPYRQIIGSLMYLAVGTRPDIAFAVNNLSQFLDNPSFEHWKAAKRILRYLQGTIQLGLTL